MKSAFTILARRVPQKIREAIMMKYHQASIADCALRLAPYRLLKLVMISALMILTVGTNSFAQEEATIIQHDPVEHAMGRFNVYPAMEKLGRGTSNFIGGWLEIPLNIHKRYRTTDTAGSMFTGAGVGLFKGAVRTLVGVYEAVTFFIPYPEGFAPILPTLEYFNKRSKKPPFPRR